MEKSGTLGVLCQDVQPLENQGGGHKFGAKSGMVGMMLDSDGCLLKPLSPYADSPPELDELNFYRHIEASHEPVDRALRQLMPTFHGTRLVRLNNNRAVKCIKLQNYTVNCRAACVMDVKVGRVTATPDSADSKRQHESVKYLGTRLPYGFSVPGLSYSDLTSGRVVKHDKQFGKCLSEATIVAAFKSFLNASYCVRCAGQVCDALVDDLNHIADWFRQQRRYHFYASSILLVYDAAGYCTIESSHHDCHGHCNNNSSQSQSSLVECAPIKIEHTPNNMEHTHCKMESTQNNMEHAQNKMEQTQSKMESTQNRMEHTQNDVESTQNKMEHTHCKMESTQNKMEHTQNKMACARMIDFAHVHTVSAANGSVDENYLNGLNGLLSVLEQLRRHLHAP